MHNKFYASGFIYHPPSEQILLQQDSSKYPASSPWVLFGTSYDGNEQTPEELFKSKVLKLLGIEIKIVYPVYSYSVESTGKLQYIVYSKVQKLQDFSSKNDLKFSWFSFKDVLKLPITEQTKHDILVAKRVIDAATRKRLGQHTF